MKDPVETGAAPPPRPPRFRSFGIGPWLFLIALVIVVGALVAYLRPFQTGERIAENAKDLGVAIVERLRPEIQTSNFTQWRELSVKPSEGNLLEIATAESRETFSSTTNLKLFDRIVPGSKAVLEITVPATYRYHIDLDDDWQIHTEGKRVVVRAPRIRPTLPVAFDTAGVERMTSAGWARWDLDEGLAELEKGITEQLENRASDPATVAKIRDAGRLAVARFVRTWLLSRSAWGKERFEEIVVVFEGEEPIADVLPPMLRIEPEGAVSP